MVAEDVAVGLMVSVYVNTLMYVTLEGVDVCQVKAFRKVGAWMNKTNKLW